MVPLVPPQAIIDVGSSAIKYAVYRLEGARPLLVHEADPTSTGLGKGHAPGRPLPEIARERTLDVIKRHVAEAEAGGAVLAMVAATEAVRNATDRESFLDRVRRLTGPAVEVRCISPEEEARWGFLSARATLAVPRTPMLSVDPGGSSNDFAYGSGNEPSRVAGLKFGMNRLLEIVDPGRDEARVNADERAALHAFLHERYLTLPARLGEDLSKARLVATSGAVIAAGAVKLGIKEADRKSRVLATHGMELRLADFRDLIDRMSSLSGGDRRLHHPCLQPSRAAIFVHGCMIYVALLEALRLPSLTVNGYGMKLGGLIARRPEVPPA